MNGNAPLWSKMSSYLWGVSSSTYHPMTESRRKMENPCLILPVHKNREQVHKLRWRMEQASTHDVEEMAPLQSILAGWLWWFLGLVAFLFAITLLILKVYETSSWSCSGDPSIADTWEAVLDNLNLPFEIQLQDSCLCVYFVYHSLCSFWCCLVLYASYHATNQRARQKKGLNPGHPTFLSSFNYCFFQLHALTEIAILCIHWQVSQCVPFLLYILELQLCVFNDLCPEDPQSSHFWLILTRIQQASFPLIPFVPCKQFKSGPRL